LRLARDLSVDHGEKLVLRLQHSHTFAAQAPPNAAELQPDGTGTDNTEPLRHPVELQRPAGIHHDGIVHRQLLQLHRHRPRRQNDIIGRQFARLARGIGNPNPLTGQELPPALHPIDTSGLEKLLDTLRQLAHNALLALLHALQIQRNAVDIDTVIVQIALRLHETLRGFQQRLGRYAPGVETGTAERRFTLGVDPGIDTGGLQTQLRTAQCGHVAGRARPDDNDIIAITHGTHTPSRIRAGSSRISFTATRNCTASRPSTRR
jgi:hypothetical protein